MVTSDIEINDAESLVKAVLFASKCFKGQIWWRGQSCSSWGLVPSVFREDRGYQYEQGIIRRFQQRAPSRHPGIPPMDANVEWLFLMQHYRLPTRLLDWTESPLFATFFALDDPPESKIPCPDNQDGALFALSPHLLNKNQVSHYGVLMPDNPKAKTVMDDAYREGSSTGPCAVGVFPSEVDIRMMVQLSMFTVHSSGLDTQKLPDSETFLVKFHVPGNAKSTLKEHLKLIGVRRASLFPDLEHLAQETADLRFREPPSDWSSSAGFGFDTSSPST